MFSRGTQGFAVVVDEAQKVPFSICLELIWMPEMSTTNITRIGSSLTAQVPKCHALTSLWTLICSF